MKNFYIVANSTKNDALQKAHELKNFLKIKGARCLVDECPKGYPDKDRLPADTDCILVLGGDGTLLKAVSSLGHPSIPFMGINAGNLGFLASVDMDGANEALNKILRDDYLSEDRMMIWGDVRFADRSREEAKALNEVVITGREPMQFITVSVHVNGQYLTRLSGDGIMVATPTGSTGYNLSAGGPIVNPTSRMMILTPICGVSALGRSIVFSEDDVITIEVDEGRHGEVQQLEAVFDGTSRINIASGDAVCIKKSDKITKLVKVTEETFLETLHNKLRDE